MVAKKQKTTSKNATSSRNEPRSRTFTGCGTCRSRHLKCDEAKPICRSCRRLNLSCQGYTPQLLWIGASGPGGKLNEQKHEGNSFRYPLFTEEDRTSMGQDMVRSLGKQCAGDALLDLDNASVSDDELYGVGPFHVFKLVQNSSGNDEVAQSGVGSPPAAASEDDVEELPPTTENGEGFTPFTADALAAFNSGYEFSNFSNELERDIYDMNMDINFGLSWDDASLSLLPNDFDIASPMGSVKVDRLRRILSRSQSRSPTPNLTSDPSKAGFPTQHPGYNGHDEAPNALSRAPSPRDGNISRSSSSLPSHTAVLLQYLKDQVLDGSTSPMHRGMSPWKILLLPCALETVAEISLWNTTSCARRSILATLLAKSAFHLSKSKPHEQSTASFWLQIGMEHQQEAQKHLQSALNTELETEGKYVEMLTAILSVGVVAVYYHGPGAIRKLLIDAEHLIRSRGLPATKTFRHRVLHHMYTHLRLILETTKVTTKSLAATERQAENSSSQLIEYTIPRSFGIQAENLGDLDLNRQKPEDVGYNDIHLDVTGVWQATLYPEIYGVPESLMSLLSQTISLVNEKPHLEATGIRNPAVSMALSKHIRTLEQQIWSWKASSGSHRNQSTTTAGDSSQNLSRTESMILAMHQAVVIFFYRRVYNMSVMIIQSQVQKVLEYIEPCLEMCKFDSDFSVSIGWSTFIAVCDAATPDLQELGLRCLKAVDDHGMFLEYGKPSVMAKAVWEQREKTHDFTFGWPDLLSQQARAIAS